MSKVDWNSSVKSVELMNKALYEDFKLVIINLQNAHYIHYVKTQLLPKYISS